MAIQKKLLHNFFWFCFPPQGASEEELKKLEKEVREQEQLLSGYQLENERLYKELKQIQAKEKANEARMFSENQKLGKDGGFSCTFCVTSNKFALSVTVVSTKAFLSGSAQSMLPLCRVSLGKNPMRSTADSSQISHEKKCEVTRNVMKTDELEQTLP